MLAVDYVGAILWKCKGWCTYLFKTKKVGIVAYLTVKSSLTSLSFLLVDF